MGPGVAVQSGDWEATEGEVEMVRCVGRWTAVAVALALACAGAAWAFQQLPSGGQVNDDPAAGISPAQSVAEEDPTNADVVGGALTAGKPAVPWAIFQQSEPSGGHDQVFVRSFAAGAWTTRGSGTIGGRSSAAPSFSGSLNFDQTQDGEVPSIDFAGAGRSVPWAVWYEDTTGTSFGATNIFASRFDNSGDANSGKWLFEGQGRGTGGAGPEVPSLNIHTDRDAENPSIAGGATVAGNAPGPWVAWQESDGATPSPQIFVSKAVKPTVAPTCPADGANPARPASATGAVATFCWQQVGVERLASGQSAPNNTTDPTLNVDTHRNGIEPDIAFTGTNDTVPWVVWYETGTPSSGLHANDMVFAAKGVAPSTTTPPTGTVDGGFNWVAVGGTAQGVLDDSADGGSCGQSADNEAACSLNKDPDADAEDPRVAAGTMTAGSPTVPWVAWDETVGTSNQVFVSRLVGSGASAHFELANDGQPVSLGSNPSTRADITFSGNTPYVSWREDIGGGVEKAFVGHFVDAGDPTFVLDESDVPLTPSTTADVREPISSACTANPFNGDGASCQGGAVGTPFFLFTNGNSPLSLFADAYQPDAPVTGAASGLTPTTATVSGSVNPVGAAVSVSFNFGTSTAYGQKTAPETLGPANTATAFTAQLSGLPAASTIHYQAVVTTDFGTFSGADATLKTATAPDRTPPTVTAKVVKSTIAKLLRSGKLKVTLTISEAGTVKLSASTSIKQHGKRRTVSLGSAKPVFRAAGKRTVTITVPSSAVHKLAQLTGGATVTVSFRGTDRAGNRSKPKTAKAFFSRR